MLEEQQNNNVGENIDSNLVKEDTASKQSPFMTRDEVRSSEREKEKKRK